MNLKIKHAIPLVVALLIAVSMAVGVMGWLATRNAVHAIETGSMHNLDTQTRLSNLMLKMETNRSQVLQALQHNPGTDFAKMHDHPATVHFGAIAANSEQLKQRLAQAGLDQGTGGGLAGAEPRPRAGQRDGGHGRDAGRSMG